MPRVRKVHELYGVQGEMMEWIDQKNGRTYEDTPTIGSSAPPQWIDDKREAERKGDAFLWDTINELKERINKLEDKINAK